MVITDQLSQNYIRFKKTAIAEIVKIKRYKLLKNK